MSSRGLIGRELIVHRDEANGLGLVARLDDLAHEDGEPAWLPRAPGVKEKRG